MALALLEACGGASPKGEARREARRQAQSGKMLRCLGA